VALRFVSGIGMAAIPASIMMLAARLFRKGSEGLSIGLADGAYAVGGIIALSSWTVLSGLVGWRTSLTIGGLLELAIVPMLFWVLPVDQIQNDFNVRFPDIRRILFDKRLLIVGIALLALEIGWTTNGYFMVFYLEDHFNIVPLIAGLIGSLTLLTGVIFSPLVGRINDRISKPQRLMFATGIICALGLVATSFNSVNGAIVSTILVGSSNAGGFAVGFIVARESAKHQREYEALGMSWVSTVSFIGSFWIPGLFSSIALQFGYSAAWVAVALLTVVLTFPVISMWPKPQDTPAIS
jgi:MFS family permease